MLELLVLAQVMEWAGKHSISFCSILRRARLRELLSQDYLGNKEDCLTAKIMNTNPFLGSRLIRRA